MSRRPANPQPAEAQAPDRRRSQRYALSVPVTLTTRNSSLEGHTLAISAHGGLVGASKLPCEEELCDAVLSLPAGDLTARVVITRVEPEEHRFTMEFVTTPENAHLLTEFLASAGVRSKID